MNDHVKTPFRPLLAIRRYRLPLLLVLACLDCVLYLYLNRRDHWQLVDLGPLLSLPGDFGDYAIRFASSLVLFGLIPLLAALVLGLKPREIGLRPSTAFLRSPVFLVLLLVFPLVSAQAALGADLGSFYPFSKSLVNLFPGHEWLLGLHGLLYLTCYYLPWEVLFRGLLVFPFLPAQKTDRDPNWREVLGNPAVLGVACWQILPTVLIHYPSPLNETLGALPFGIIAALVSLRFRSVLPILIVHFFCGFATDCTIVLHAAGVI